jgi:hypothetical protein
VEAAGVTRIVLATEDVEEAVLRHKVDSAAARAVSWETESTDAEEAPSVLLDSAWVAPGEEGC